MGKAKTIGLVFIEGFADWEFGLLAASAVEWFDLRSVALTPGGKPVRSMAGFQLEGARGLSPEENTDLDGVALIGSERWMAQDAPDLSSLLTAVMDRGGIVGGICGGTLGLARTGLFKQRRHTSNGRDWINQHAPGYDGAEHYQDVPYAVADGPVVTAPGSAPGTFAITFMNALMPDQGDTITQMRTLFAREYEAA